jgi:hypothetical protein
MSEPSDRTHSVEQPWALNRRQLLLAGGSLVAAATVQTAASVGPAQAQASGKPNILVIFGDDIGYWNISAYNKGMMGYRTPNIDRIAKEGAIFTDLYACTAGRAAFITGQSCFRTGLLKVGLPGAKEGLSEKDPTLAELLKPQGYATGQFGKNHLGDRNEFLPTVHGFDEFFGNLTTSTRRMSRKTRTIPRTGRSSRSSGRVACSSASRPTPTIPPRTRALEGSASRRSRTRARSLPSAWRPWTRSSSVPP